MSTRLGTTAKYWAMREINRRAITEPGLNEIFAGTCGALKKVLPYDRMACSLYAPEHEGLRLTAADGQSLGSFFQVGLMLDCQASHHGWVFQHQKPILRRDLRSELEFEVEQHNVDEGIQSYCAVPLIARGESVGVIIVLSSQKNRYSDAHIEFLQEVSDQLVLAVKCLIPTCRNHAYTKLVCPRCIASSGGQTTAAKYRGRFSDWGKQGGRGRKKPVGG